MSKYNILIVEDHALTRFGLKTTFETAENIGVIHEASNASSAIECAKSNKIDVVIMDLGLPDVNGIEAAKRIKEIHPELKIIMLSSHEDKTDVLKSIKAGANAYCTKDIDPSKLLSVTDSVIKGAAWFDSKVAQYILSAAVDSSEKENVVNNDSPKIDGKNTEKNTDTNLTSREKQVLKLIVDGYSNNEIAQKLDVSINTTKAHVCNILQKLAVNDRTQAAIKAIKDNII